MRVHTRVRVGFSAGAKSNVQPAAFSSGLTTKTESLHEQSQLNRVCYFRFFHVFLASERSN